MDEGEKVLFVGGMVMVFIFGMMISQGFATADVALSQEVADDVCFQLTGNKSASASIDTRTFWKGEGKLVCEIPSFDSTQNIIVRDNSGE